MSINEPTSLTFKQKALIRARFLGKTLKLAAELTGMSESSATRILATVVGKTYLNSLNDEANYDIILSKRECLEKLASFTNDSDVQVRDKIGAIKEYAKLANYQEAQKVEVDIKSISIKRI